MDVPVFESDEDIGVTDGFSMILFLDNLPSKGQVPFYVHDDMNTAGGLLEISKRGNFPFVSDGSNQLAPGKWRLFC